MSTWMDLKNTIDNYKEMSRYRTYKLDHIKQTCTFYDETNDKQIEIKYKNLYNKKKGW